MSGIRYWIRMSWTIAAAAAAVILVFGRFNGWPSPRALAETFAVALAFSCCIGVPLSLVMPRVAPKLWRICRFPLNWVAMMSVMIAIAVAGSVVAIALLTAVRYVPASQFTDWFLGSLRISVIVTLTFGTVVTLYEGMRAQLEEAAAALRKKERDEADARRLAAEAQLASLESRVQPHFLFNTLNSIAALIPEDPAGAERMTGQLASLLRFSLDKSETTLVPLEQEVKIVRDYLDIERVRFGDRLRFAVQIDPAVGNPQVPRLSLQTLLENSVKYAVATRREGGSIVIRAARQEDRIALSVTDDGPGFPPQELPASHGLELLKERLRMTFGDRAALTVTSAPGHTNVTITLPRETEHVRAISSDSQVAAERPNETPRR